ncbi:MAG: putative DNA-binding domain-containing protein [Alphaproteobacteria bacterium]|nr:putative DNA-binding domain-containing protein [Alphaproteobacteria bacterium]MCB9930127.1 putative DNA-binding domain-containing protein [Alphaproteobacteria bacterium]
MSRLAALQARFQAGILSESDDRVLADLDDAAGENAATRFGIYRYAYTARLVEVLQANFEYTWSLLGDEGFADAARTYVRTGPSRFRNARWFGDGLAPFLARRFAETPAVGDVAALDWAIAGAFDAPDSPPMRAEALAALHPQAWPGLRFGLHPSVRVVPVATPAAAICEALATGNAPPLDPVEPHTVLVWRDEATVRYRALEADEAAALDAVAAGRSFAEVCETLAQRVGAEAAGARAATLLAQWLAAGVIGRMEGDESINN